MVSRSRIAFSIAFLFCSRFGLQVPAGTCEVSSFTVLRLLVSDPGPVRFSFWIWPPVAFQILYFFLAFGAAGCIAIVFVSLFLAFWAQGLRLHLPGSTAGGVSFLWLRFWCSGLPCHFLLSLDLASNFFSISGWRCGGGGMLS